MSIGVSTESTSDGTRRGPRALDRSGTSPLWTQLQDDLSRRLALGEFDSAFPGEHELVAEYAVSRHTVREALRRLRERGVLDTARGRASHVRRGYDQPLGTLYSLFREVEMRGMVQTSVVLAQALVTDGPVARRLGLAPEAELFHLERVRLADGEPLAYDRVWLPASIARGLVDATFTRTALYDELAAQTGVVLTDGTERVGAVVPDERVRELLDVPADVACLRIQRVGRRAGTVMEVRDTIVRGDRYAVVTDFSSAGSSVGVSAREDPESYSI